jgi:thymidylate synthase (FAD)
MPDARFRVVTLAATPYPQRTCWAAMHQDYSEDFVGVDPTTWPSEERAGELLVKHLLAGHRGHYGPLEHAQLVVNCGWFPHSVMQQARTHRVGVSFDVQSGRYTGKRLQAAAAGELDVEDVIYLRPPGAYTDRQGKRYLYSEAMRQQYLEVATRLVANYATAVERFGLSEEHARGMVPFDFRQHFVASFSLRALMHFLDLRAKEDAQLEIRQLCDLLWPEFLAWAPQVADWYRRNRWAKARLAP